MTVLAVWSVSAVVSLPGLAISPILGDLNKVFPHATDLEIQMLTSLPSVLIIPFMLLAGRLSVTGNKFKLLVVGLTVFFLSGFACLFINQMWLLILVSCLTVLKTDAGRYRYFAGGFATKAEAVDAQELLRAKGFRRPELVVWYDGEYTNLTRTPEAEMAAFRVEISSEQNLSDTVKQAIAQAAPGCDLSRVGADLFVVGQFDNKAVADQAAAAIRAADPQLSVKVTEIAK